MISLLFQLLFFLIRPNFAAEVFIPNEHFPTEFRLLIISLQTDEMNPTTNEWFKKNLSLIDTYAPLLTKNDISFLYKTEIYKSILEEIRTSTDKKEIVLGDNYPPLKINKDFVKKYGELLTPELKATLSPFTWWVFKSLESDLQRIFNVSSGKQPAELEKFKLTHHLINELIHLKYEEINQHFKLRMSQILDKLAKLTFLQVKYTHSLTHLDYKTPSTQILEKFQLFEKKEGLNLQENEQNNSTQFTNELEQIIQKLEKKQ